MISTRVARSYPLSSTMQTTGLRVVRELDGLIAWRGRPTMCVSDNGTELTGMAILRWSQETRVEWHYIAPGKPQQNRYTTGDNCCISLSALYHGVNGKPARCVALRER